MKLCRYRHACGGPVRVGLVDGGSVRDVSAVADALPALHWPLPPGDLFIAHLDEPPPRITELARSAEPVPLTSVQLKSPVANPGKFLCGAGNHVDVLAAGGHPRKLGLLFKMTSAAAGASDGVTLRWPERGTFHQIQRDTLLR